MESVCGGYSTAGSNPALSASRLASGAHLGVRALCIAVLRTVSGPEGSSTKREYDECRRLPGLHGGLVRPLPVPASVSVPDNHINRDATRISPKSHPPLASHRWDLLASDEVSSTAPLLQPATHHSATRPL